MIILEKIRITVNVRGDSVREYRARIIDTMLERKLKGKGVVLIEGSRLCGKTTTAEQISKSVLYMAKPSDVKPFMDDFIKFYKTKSLSVVDSNPFLKSALAHLLFVRIHPFSDGNGRMARMIHDMWFTESINNIYGMGLKLCPLNLSQSILINQFTYVNRINDIYFDLEQDSNHEINRWFDFILNMVDEQLYYSKERIPRFKRLVPALFDKNVESNNSQIAEEIKKIKIK